jgi:DNA-binding IclR family transcriptional regulator
MASGGTSKQGGRPVSSVARAITAIDALAAAPAGLGVSELARLIGVNPSSASRLLATLQRADLVARRPDGRFQLGLRFVALADHVLAGLDVRELARPHLHALVERTGETATLSIPTGGEAVTVDFVPGSSSVVSMARVGRPNPLHATAIGKVMLAFGRGADPLPPAERLTRYTDVTVTAHAPLARAVEQVRGDGWAAAVGEREADLAALAAPVRGSAGTLVAVIGLQGPLARMSEQRRAEMAPLLLDAAARLSRELGGSA